MEVLQRRLVYTHPKLLAIEDFIWKYDFELAILRVSSSVVQAFSYTVIIHYGPAAHW
jgi:hypothetical protein